MPEVAGYVVVLALFGWFATVPTFALAAYTCVGGDPDKAIRTVLWGFFVSIGKFDGKDDADEDDKDHEEGNDDNGDDETSETKNELMIAQPARVQ